MGEVLDSATSNQMVFQVCCRARSSTEVGHHLLRKSLLYALQSRSLYHEAR